MIKYFQQRIGVLSLTGFLALSFCANVALPSEREFPNLSSANPKGHSVSKANFAYISRDSSPNSIVVMDSDFRLKRTISLDGMTFTSVKLIDGMLYVVSISNASGGNDRSIYAARQYFSLVEGTSFSGIVCRIDDGRCQTKVSGGYIIRDFQPYKDGHIYLKARFEDYVSADYPGEIASSVMFASDSGNVALNAGYIGGASNLYVHDDNIYVHVSKFVGQLSDGVDGVGNESATSRVGMYRLLPDGRAEKLAFQYFLEPFSAQISAKIVTDGVRWAASFYDVLDGRLSGFSSTYCCVGQFDGRNFFHTGTSVDVDGSGHFYFLNTDGVREYLN